MHFFRTNLKTHEHYLAFLFGAWMRINSSPMTHPACPPFYQSYKLMCARTRLLQKLAAGAGMLTTMHASGALDAAVKTCPHESCDRLSLWEAQRWARVFSAQRKNF
jgi:hypothetical protein